MSESNSERPRGKKLSSLWQVAGFLRPYTGRLLAASAALVFTASATLAVGRGLQVLIDRGFGSGDSEQLAQAVMGMVAIAAAIAIGTFARFYLVSWLGERVSADIRIAVFNNVVGLHPSYFELNRSGEIMSRLTTDTTLLQTIIGSSFSMALRSALTTSGALVLMLITNIKLSLMILMGVPLVLLPILLFGKRVRRLSNRSQDSIASVGSYAGEVIGHIKTVQSYTSEDHERQAFKNEVENAFAIARRRIRQRASLIAAAILLMFCGMAGMLWSGGQDVISGAMTGGEMAAFVFYAMMVGMGVATVSEVWGELQRAAGATERLMELLQTRSEILEPSAEGTRGKLHPAICFEGVSFNYPTRPNTPALQELDLVIEAGKSLALVGPSGAGKSTLFELIQRFYDPQQGVIRLGDMDIRDLPTQELRQHMALVSQQPALFTADVRYNIAYGRPGATDAEVEAAARAAHAHDFIKELPEGYASHLGDRGVRLSGGQRQRIALARAILNDPDILLLDEATSALDSESEYHVQQALEELMQNRTTVIIAHRLSTIRHADRILVLDGGRVQAVGSHESLLHSSPLYARLSRLQFRDGAPQDSPDPTQTQETHLAH